MNDQPVDPMEVLAVPSNPVAPRPAFAADLRTRMLRELGLGTADDIPDDRPAPEETHDHDDTNIEPQHRRDHHRG